MQQPPTNEMAHRGLSTNQGIWCYRCRTCCEVFTSSQGLAGHQRKHMFQGTWVRGAPHEKFLCPSTHLPALYRQLGNRKTTPTVLPGQGRFYRPRLRKPVVQGPCRLPGRPRSVFDPSQQQALARVLPQPHGHPKQQQERVQVPHVAAPAPVTPLLIHEGLFAHPLNQVFTFGIQLNPDVALAARPLESTDSSSTVTVTADWMVGNEINVNEEIEKLDLELRL